jgi:chromosomal replication initiation ATPase DnaA
MTNLTLQKVNRKVNDLIIEITSLKQRLGLYEPEKLSSNEKISRIVRAVEKHYDLPEGMVYAKTQKEPIPEARNVCIVLIDKSLKMNRYEIALEFSMSPSCIRIAHNVINSRVKLYAWTREKYLAICHDLNLEP